MLVFFSLRKPRGVRNSQSTVTARRRRLDRLNPYNLDCDSVDRVTILLGGPHPADQHLRPSVTLFVGRQEALRVSTGKDFQRSFLSCESATWRSNMA